MKGIPFVTEKKVVFRGVREGTSKKGKKYYQAIFMDGLDDLIFFVTDENKEVVKSLQAGKEYKLKITLAGKFINLVDVA